jgi:hypothetical protein
MTFRTTTPRLFSLDLWPLASFEKNGGSKMSNQNLEVMEYNV